jgi:hypothetical protein
MGFRMLLGLSCEILEATASIDRGAAVLQLTPTEIEVYLRPTVSRAPIWSPLPDFVFYQTIASVLMWSALFNERTGL